MVGPLPSVHSALRYVIGQIATVELHFLGSFLFSSSFTSREEGGKANGLLSLASEGIICIEVCMVLAIVLRSLVCGPF